MLVAYVISFFLPLLMNSTALVVRYKGEYYFPIVTVLPGVDVRAWTPSASPTTAT